MPNLIPNGSFVDHAGDWYPLANGATAAHDPASRDGTGGCLLVAAADEGLGAACLPGGANGVPLGGLTTVDAVVWARSPTAGATAFLTVAFYATERLSAGLGNVFGPGEGVALDDDGWTEVALRDVAVPVGAVYARLTTTILGTGGPWTARYDDVYLGAADGDAPPYAGAAAAAFPANRVPRGAFEANIAGWAKWDGGETLAHETAAPLVGAGSLRVTTPGGTAEEGPYAIDTFVVVPGEALRFSCRAAGTATVRGYVWYSGAATPALGPWTLVPGGADLVADFVVPAGAWLAYVALVTPFAQAGTFTADEFVVGPDPDPPVDEPAATSPAVLRALANRARLVQR